MNHKIVGVMIVCASLLTGCIGDELSDLKAHVASTKAKKGDRIPPLPTFETYVTVPYAASHLKDPFMPIMEVSATPAASNADNCPPLSHKREPLEKFPLDALKFVGTLERKGEQWAIIAAPDKLVHRVKTGNYLGQNYGKITSISEVKLEVMENVADGLGGCVERAAALSVAE